MYSNALEKIMVVLSKSKFFFVLATILYSTCIATQAVAIESDASSSNISLLLAVATDNAEGFKNRAQALGKIGSADTFDEEAFSVIQTLACDTSEIHLRGYAIFAMASMGRPAYVRMAKDLQDNDTNYRQRQLASSTLLEASQRSKLREPLAKTALPALIAALEDKEASIRWRAAVSLLNLKYLARDSWGAVGIALKQDGFGGMGKDYFIAKKLSKYGSAKDNHRIIAKELIAQSDQHSKFVDLVRKGNAKSISEAIAQGAEINRHSVGREGYDPTSLMIAVELENKDVVKLLLDKGADVNAVAKLKGKSPVTALVLARRKGNEELKKMLTEHGAKKLHEVYDGPMLFRFDKAN